MKTICVSLIVLASTSLYADCSNTPVGVQLAKTIEAHDVAKAKVLLAKYKDEVKTYLKGCNNQDKFEETSILIHTYEDRLADVEHDLHEVAPAVSCSKVPNSETLENAFKTNHQEKIESLYKAYKKNARAYIEHCATHAEYETVYESSMFCDEMYDEWKSKQK